jgi:hypothetical protein
VIFVKYRRHGGLIVFPLSDMELDDNAATSMDFAGIGYLLR